MPLDALCLSGVIHELNTSLAGARVDKIYQPGRDEVVLALRTQNTGNVRLLLSASPPHPRLHLTTLPLENPEKPPMFCMLLRKHMSGARLLEIVQTPLERVAVLRFEALNELGDRVERKLVLEAISHKTNLLLLDGEGRILDCIRHTGGDVTAGRILQPGMFYRLPPRIDKENPLTADREKLEALLSAAPEEAQADRWLLDTFGGLSPLVCRELAHRAGGSTDIRLNALGPEGRGRLLDRLTELQNIVMENRFTPTVVSLDGRPKDFTFLPVEQYGGAAEITAWPGFSPLLDAFFEQRERQDRVKQKGQDLIKLVTNARDRTARKLGNQEKELAATKDRDRLRQLGDIVTSNFYQMEKGMARLRAADFYDPEGKEIEIKLDPLLTPQQNAAKYYKDYNRAKKAEEMLTIQLEKGRQELDYLNSVLENISLAEGERDLTEIRQELTDTGYLRRPGKAKDRGRRAVSKPMEFISTTGLRISVGKNNSQNDLLTCRLAGKGDIWFHTQKIHGSHVILWTEGGQPDLQSLNEAAVLAAWFSQARDSSKVPVDYTPVRYVKKPGGARPGMVIYTTYETAQVTPDGELAKRLRVK
ncbi:fibronectin/fibrinogen-binding protein [Colidextribacter sp. OB.20]|uniref:Rqc2 family fibronectin-binding protein n=1 Tax=Colidextribacter sp. OB.20 TaxID=2304568 RepID=UPI00136B4DFF|nr:NFACT RNA binding domain-containing protein [Colidextribacter sp. OB.20]NBI09450.1 fibronectin/fibrinogen-binding protein [Colidextribacter sp. OB.20]